MTKYILLGGFDRTHPETTKGFFQELVRDVPEGGTVLLVYFACRSNDEEERFKEQKQKIATQFFGKHYRFVMANTEDFIEQIKNADVILFNGGSTNKLLAILKEYSDLLPLFAGKVVAGSSAGAYALVRFGASHSEEVVREGLGFVPVRLVCHYESPDVPPTGSSVSALKSMAHDLELVLLKEGEWKTFNG